MVGARVNQGVVFVEHPARDRHGLDADEPADSLSHRLHERLALTQAVNRFQPVHLFEVVAGVQVREDGPRFVPSGQGDLDDPRPRRPDARDRR